jgi:TetR/AcrR family transcriptional regulator
MDGNFSRDLIAKTALSLFSRKGYESVGVNEIAAVTGLTKPSLYHHFGSKDGLLAFIVETEGQKLTALTENAAKYEHDIVKNLTALLRENVAFACANSDVFRLLLRLFASAPEAPGFETGAELRGTLINIYANLFFLASKDHGNMKSREKIYAETFWGLIATCATLAINRTLKLDDGTLYRIVHQYMHGIFS